MAQPREIEFVFEPQQEGGYHVHAADLPGLHTQGGSLEEATDNAREALHAVRRGPTRGRPPTRDRRRAPQAAAARVTPRLPVVSGARLIRALERHGWQVIRQRTDR